jgi:hypothetical protein
MSNPFPSAKWKTSTISLAWKITKYKSLPLLKTDVKYQAEPITGAQFPSELQNTIRSATSGTSF